MSLLKMYILGFVYAVCVNVHKTSINKIVCITSWFEYVVGNVGKTYGIITNWVWSGTFL